MKESGFWIKCKEKFLLSNGSSYEGKFLDGKFIWKIRHVYIGAWKGGKTEGEGEFKHQDGHILRGSFNNNYIFYKDINAFLDPFLLLK